MVPPLQGRLSTFGFADLLQWMDLNQRSGRLTIVRGTDRRTVEWKDGDIVHVSGYRPQDRLGVFLCRTKALPAATLHALLARNLTGEANLTRLILDGGHDTLAGLSRKVEDLAKRLLFEIFEWRDAAFEYDPTSPVERILRIRLGLRPQVLAMHAVKDIDDARRRSRKTVPLDERETLFEPEDVAERFWGVLEKSGFSADAAEGERRFAQARVFAERLGERLGRIGPLRPIHDDSAALLRELRARGPLEPSAVEKIAALDPSLAADLVILANTLVTDRRSAVVTVAQALERLEAEPLAALVERLAASEFPRLAADDPAAAAVRRASIAAAVAAGRAAPKKGIPAERGYALGLLHALAYGDLLAAAEESEVEPGRFRAALIEAYRPLVGRIRSEAFNLPAELEKVLTDDGTDGSPAAVLVRSARAALPACAIGPLPEGSARSKTARALSDEVDRLLGRLGLPGS